ncbi:MAG TPA: hypothetical protein VIU15_44170 [Streptomyces sp.]
MIVPQVHADKRGARNRAAPDDDLRSGPRRTGTTTRTATHHFTHDTALK